MAPADVGAAGAGAGGRWRRARAWAEVAAVSALAAAIAAAAVVGDLRRPFDPDELFTYYTGQAPDFAGLRGVLSSGGFDASPPLYVLAAWQAQRLVADPHLAYRLPATVGFVAMCLCLYAFARRRCPAPYAIIAMLTPPSTLALGFASYARSYGLMLGLCGVAILCWQAAAEGRRRPAALVGLAASLAAGVATHYYTVLLLAPLGLAELARTLAERRGRPDPAVWLALACAFVPLAFLGPLVAHSREIQRGAAWLRVDPRELWITYTVNLPAFLPILVAFGLVLLMRPPADGGRGAAAPRYPAGEIALILGLLLLPALAFALGVVVTKAYSPRYVAFHLAGVGLLLAYVGAALFPGRRAVGLALAAVMVAGFLKPARAALAAGDWSWRGEVESSAARAAADGRRLLFTNGGDYIVGRFYADPATAGRLTYVIFGDEGHARMFGNLGRWLSGHGLGSFDVVDERDFFEHPGRYYVYGPIGPVQAAAGDRPLAVEWPGGAGHGRFFAVAPPADGRR